MPLSLNTGGAAKYGQTPASFTAALQIGVLRSVGRTLTAIPSQAGVAINLTWDQPPFGTVDVERWVDGGSPTVIASVTAASSYVDSTVAINTIYYYRVSRGINSSNTATAVYSDITKAFVVPAMEPVAAELLGVDREESFVGANGLTTSFTILVPTTNALTLNVPPVGIGSDYTNIAAAIAAIKAAGSGTLELDAGNYILNPAGEGIFANIQLGMMNNARILGAGHDANLYGTTNIYFRKGGAFNDGTMRGLSLNVTNKVLIRDINFDWDFPNAIPGVVDTVDATKQRLYVTNPTYYIPDPINPPDVVHVTAYHLADRAYNISAGGRVGLNGTFNTNFAVDGLYYYEFTDNYLPDGIEAIFYVETSHGIEIGPAAFNTSLERVGLLGGGGAGLIIGSQGQNTRLSNCHLTRRPDALLRAGEQPRYVSFFGDSDANSNLGNTLIENSEIGFVNDDIFYLRGSVVQLQTLASTSGFTVVKTARSVTHAFTAGNEALLFIDPLTQAPISAGQPQATWTHTFDGGTNMWTWTVTFTPAIPELEDYFGLPEAEMPIVSQPAWSCPNYIIRKSCFHDGYGRIFGRTANGLIEDNTFGNLYYSAMEFGSNPTFLAEGPGPSNTIVRRNKVVGCGWGQADWNELIDISAGYHQTGWALGAITVYGSQADGFMPSGYPYKDLEFTDNFICNTPGLGISIHGAEEFTITGNVVVNANMLPYAAGFNAAECGVLSQGVQAAGSNQPWCLAKVAAQGSIMVSHSRNGVVQGNTSLGESDGVFIDTATTSAVTT